MTARLSQDRLYLFLHKLLNSEHENVFTMPRDNNGSQLPYAQPIVCFPVTAHDLFVCIEPHDKPRRLEIIVVKVRDTKITLCYNYSKQKPFHMYHSYINSVLHVLSHKFTMTSLYIFIFLRV